MLLFIEMNPCPSVRIAIFQYISCYCLSRALPNKWRQRWNFNTSHVTVYQKVKLVMYVYTEFQYISCYCLSYPNAPATGATYYFNTSHVTVYPIIQPVFWYHFLISIHLMLLFIILSNTVYHILSIISIHLMLLFIKMIRLERANVMHFNTSHVTVYLLVFIMLVHIFTFQYISCYCLSYQT